MHYFQHLKTSVAILDVPNALYLHSRGPYFWVEPARRFRNGMFRVMHRGDMQTIKGKTLFFPESFLSRQETFWWNEQEVTQLVLEGVAQLRRKREIAGTKTNGYAIWSEPLRRLAFQRFFRPKLLCSGIFLQARPGVFTAVMGPSGCGKSVFLKMLAGCDRPSDGRIFVQGRPLDKMIDRVGFVPQGDVLLPELTAEKSLNYTLELFAPFLNARERNAIIAHVADSLELKAEVLKMRIGRNEWQGEYPSGGQRRRISLAHELVRRPDVLLLDEPTSGLSTTDGEKVMELLGNLSKSEQTTIVVTVHSPSRLMYAKFDDLLLLASGGRVCYYGPAADAFKEFMLYGQDSPDLLLTALDTADRQDAKVRSHDLLVNTPGWTTTQYRPRLVPQ